MEIGPQNQCLMPLKSVKSWYIMFDEKLFGVWFSNPFISGIGLVSVFIFVENDNISLETIVH